jgi:hypothetical protein
MDAEPLDNNAIEVGIVASVRPRTQLSPCWASTGPADPPWEWRKMKRASSKSAH